MKVNDCRVRDGFDFKFLAFNFQKRNQPFEFTGSGGILAKDSGAPASLSAISSSTLVAKSPLAQIDSQPAGQCGCSSDSPGPARFSSEAG